MTAPQWGINFSARFSQKRLLRTIFLVLVTEPLEPFDVRRIFSIAMIALILLNTLGYYGLLFGLEVHNSRSVTRNLDRDNYDVSKAVMIEIPLTVPYGVDSRDFKRVDGLFEYNGDFYRLVKQRLHKDVLQVVCVKDEKHRAINEAMGEYAGTLSDKTDDSSSSHLKSIDFIKDYISTSISVCETTAGWSLNVALFQPSEKLISDFLSSIIHPPERGN